MQDVLMFYQLRPTTYHFFSISAGFAMYVVLIVKPPLNFQKTNVKYIVKLGANEFKSGIATVFIIL